MRTYALALFVCLACVGAAKADEPQAQAAAESTIRTNVQEVVLDVVVRDAKGKAVKNLKAEEIEVLEDGVKQDVKSFRFVGGREAAARQAKAAPKQSGLQALAPVNLICIVYHNMDTDPLKRQFVAEAVQEFLKAPLPPDTYVASFSLDARLRLLHAPTKDRAELAQDAMRSYSGNLPDFATTASAMLSASPNQVTTQVAVNGTPGQGGTVDVIMKITGGELNKGGIYGAEVSTGAGASRVRGEQVAQRRSFGGIEGHVQLDQIDELVATLKEFPGRKTVLLLSPGLLTTGDPDFFDPIIERANKSAITFYSLDINGLSQNSTTLAGTGQLSHVAEVSAGQRNGTSRDMSTAKEQMRQGDALYDAVRNADMQAPLRQLAESTGGALIANTNDLKKPFQRMAEDLDTYYEVVYRPTSPRLDGALRNIEVKVARNEASVQSRTGYFALPLLAGSGELASHEIAGLAALSLNPRPHAFDFRAAALQFRPSPAGSRMVLAFGVPAGSLTTLALPAVNKTRVHLSLTALVKDSTGNVVHKFSKDAPYEVPNDAWANVKNGAIDFEEPVDLPPGKYTMDIAVVDRTAMKSSTTTVAFESPEPSALGLSSVALVQRFDPMQGKADPNDPLQLQASPTETRRVIPELATAIPNNAKPAVFFTVYPDRANPEKPKVQVEFLINGKLAAKQVAELPAPDANGAIPMVVGAVVKPGNCELRITAVQGSASKTQSVKYTVAGA